MSPIVLFCFKRLNTLIDCIESLKLCPEAIYHDLIIFSDAGRNKDEQRKVKEVRAYISEISGFKSVQIKIRKENLGVDYNIITGIQEVAQVYDSFIVIEDDLVVSSQFLQFMNEGLEYFEDFGEVLTLSAFNYVNIPKNYDWDIYFASRTNPWGWATWSSKIKHLDWNMANNDRFLSDSKQKKAFNSWGSDRSRMLRRTLIGEIRAWDIRLDYFQFKNNMVTVYATKNLIINNGFNSHEATNTNGYNRYKVELEKFDNNAFNFPDFIYFDPIIKKRFISKNSIYNRVITIIFKFFNINN